MFSVISHIESFKYLSTQPVYLLFIILRLIGIRKFIRQKTDHVKQIVL